MSDTQRITGPRSIQVLMEGIDPKVEIPKIRKEIQTTKSVAKRDALIKRLKYLVGLAEQNTNLGDAVMLHNVPVAPPIIRPIIQKNGNSVEYADVNHLYRDHMLVNDALKDVKDILPDSELQTLRDSNYKGLKAVFGVGEAISPQSQGKQLKGYIKTIAGEGGPKSGFFHSKLLSKKQDFSGRATIYAEPNLGFNEVAVPKDMLWSMYKFHILRDLSKSGYSALDAEKAWKERSTPAVGSFNRVIENIPLIMNRAPTLMKSNVTAAYPIPVEGHTVGLNILHVPLFAGDYDGDALSFHTPMTPEAVEEAKQKLLPSHQIFDTRRGVYKSIIAPGHEAILGSVYLTEPDHTQPVRTFKTEKDVLEALKKGEVDLNSPIEISP